VCPHSLLSEGNRIRVSARVGGNAIRPGASARVRAPKELHYWLAVMARPACSLPAISSSCFVHKLVRELGDEPAAPSCCRPSSLLLPMERAACSAGRRPRANQIGLGSRAPGAHHRRTPGLPRFSGSVWHHRSSRTADSLGRPIQKLKVATPSL